MNSWPRLGSPSVLAINKQAMPTDELLRTKIETHKVASQQDTMGTWEFSSSPRVAPLVVDAVENMVGKSK